MIKKPSYLLNYFWNDGKVAKTGDVRDRMWDVVRCVRQCSPKVHT